MASSRIAGISIRGISSAVPIRQCKIEDFAEQFGANEVRKIADSTGVRTVRLAAPDQCTSDFCAVAAQRLLDRLGWQSDSIDLLVFVTQTPDYLLPATGGVLHARLGLDKKCLTIDVNQGCSGYVTGLWTAAALLSQPAMRRCLLLAGDTISKIVNERDRSTALLFGDAGTATALEKTEGSVMWFEGGSDGSGAHHLAVRSGGFRCPIEPDPRPELRPFWPHGSLVMDGTQVFTFASREVPRAIADLMHSAGLTWKTTDALVCHQANQFLLQHLARKLNAPVEKLLLSLDRFGNTSSASIPLTISDLWGTKTVDANVVLAGFGVGFSWATAAVGLKNTLVLDPIVTDAAEALAFDGAK